MGQIEFKLNNVSSSFQYFKKADSIVDIFKDYTPETRFIHNFLRDYYLKNGDTKNFEVYDAKLKKTDSILTDTYKMVNRKLVEDFEIPRIAIENEKNSESKNKTSFIIRVIIPIGLLISISGFLSSFIFIKKKKKPKKNEKNKLDGIKPEIIEKIESQLLAFEKNKSFTQKGLNLRTLSKKLQTNQSYLSRVINFSKGQNLSNYLSELRIDYCLEELDSNSTYHKFDVKSLAHEFGFNNAESFTKAFSKKTGTTPAAYIKNMKEPYSS